MCIILYHKPGARVSDEVLATCWKNNPDGGGLMWADGGRVHVSKGYMTLPDFIRAYRDIPERAPMVAHMRIGTSGGYGPEVTHPYPITGDLDALHALDVECREGIAHNGVLPYPSDDKRGISDTVAFIMGEVAPLERSRRVRRAGGIVRSKYAIGKLKADSEGSRLAILSADGAIKLTGAGWQGVTRGVQASNDSWREVKTWALYSTPFDDCGDWSDCDEWGFGDGAADDLEAFHGCAGCEMLDTCRREGYFCFDF